jgi:hypothetical protein
MNAAPQFAPFSGYLPEDGLDPHVEMAHDNPLRVPVTEAEPGEDAATVAGIGSAGAFETGVL